MAYLDNVPLTKNQVRALRALLKSHGKSPCGRKKSRKGNPIVRFKTRRGRTVKFFARATRNAAALRALKAKRRAQGRWLARNFGKFVWRGGRCYRKVPGLKRLKAVRR